MSRPSEPSRPRLLERLRHRIRVKHYIIRTEEAYVLAVRRAGTSKRDSCHTRRHSFATHLLEGGKGVKSPLEL